MAQVARISGPLLAANLKRTQANLAFDTDLLYIGHLTGKIGVKKSSPGTELDIFGQTSASEFRSNTLTSGNLRVDTSGVTSITGNIILDSLGTVHADEMHTEKLTFNDNYIGSLANSNIVFDPNGTGTVNFVSTKVNGDVSATGNITIPGDITVGGTMNFGDAVTDTLDFDYVSFTQDLKPQTTDVQNLGSANLKWNNVTVGKARIGDIEIDNDFISTTTLNNNLTVRASGTGSIVIDQLSFNGHNISTTDAPTSTFTSCTLSHTLDNPNAYGTSQDDYFPSDNGVSISGDYAIVGARREDSAVGTNQGHAYIFNTNTGAVVHSIPNPNTQAWGTSDDYFGWAVAIDGNYALVGAPREDTNNTNNDSGHVYVYNVSTGALLHTLTNPNAYGTESFDYFGEAIAISGNYAVIGVASEGVGWPYEEGYAYIYDVSTGTLLHTIANPNAYGTSTGDSFGKDVAIDGNYAIISATREDDVGGTEYGKAYIFNVSTGALVHTLDNPGTNYGYSPFGSSVGISGDYAIVGASNEKHDATDTSLWGSGKAYIFSVKTGALVHTLHNPNVYGTFDSDRFGWSVDISGNFAVASAIYEDDAGGTNSGKAYIFNVKTGAHIHTIDNPNAYGTSQDDTFGMEVAMDNTKIIIGAPKEDDAGGTTSGKSYIYDLAFSTIMSPTDLVIHPGSENLTISSVQALRVPDGTEAQRTNLNRDVRYNTTTNFFELFSTAYTPLRGIWSEDRQTYVLANADNSFSFYNNGVTNTTLTTNGLETNKLISQNTVEIDGNTISSATTNADFTLTATGTVNIANFKFDTNTIHNTVGGAIKLSKTGNQGYVHFDTVYGTVIPAGSTAQRPAGVLGQTRFNTDLAYMESWDGSQWANIAGAGGGITEQYMEELVNIYTIALA
tara:strand:- start:1343 stop:4039 length:2697 start_codon:yes stop_codon:yes gene_type:complete